MVAHEPVLNAKQVAQYYFEGYLVVEGFATADECDKLKARAEQLIDEYDPESVSIFSSSSQVNTVDDKFVRSANTIDFFFEEAAIDKNGKLVQDKNLSINKIGHALHDLDPVFREYSRSPKMLQLLTDLGYSHPTPVQSMYICKQPRVGGECVPHQDSCFLYTSPPSIVGVWLAVEDATTTNGCLQVLRCSHRQGVRRRFLWQPDGKLGFDRDSEDFDLQGFEQVPVPKGTLVLLHGENVHASPPNTSDKSRHAYTVHFMEGAGGTQWAAGNWLQRSKEFPFQALE